MPDGRRCTMAEIINDNIDFRLYLNQTEASQNVRPARDFVAEAKHYLRARTKTKRTFLPWPKCNGNFEFRLGEVTIWAGQNGSGKTDLTTQMALSLVGQGEKVCIASFEMKPRTTIGRMVRQFAGTNPYAEEYQSADGVEELELLYDDFGGWSDGSLWLYDQTKTAEAEVVLGMIKYCADTLGITHVVVDSLMKCIRAEDDYNAQKDFVDQLCAMAKDCNIHIHLVHHVKKPAKENDKPDKSDIKGSGAITDQVDNVFIVYRNKAKEDDVRANGTRSKMAADADCYLLCRKQRNYELSGDGEPTISLWRHTDAGQFVANQGDSAQFFVNYPHVAS